MKLTNLVPALLSTAALAACAVEDRATTGYSSDEIIGGVPASSQRLDAIGTLADVLPSGKVDFFCTGTLISPTVVLTAEHCIEGLVPEKTVFAIGADADHPRGIYRVRAAVAETSIPTDVGFVGLGADVAVVHLAEPVTAVAPMAFAKFDPSLVGRRFSLVGYGARNNDFDSGKRMAGSLTLSAVAGRVYEIVFGTFENFVAHLPDLYPEGVPDDLDPAFEFEDFRLDEGLDAWFGGRPGDANTCFGDSGGPAITTVNGVPTIMAVVSGGFGSAAQVCDFGGAEAILGPVALDFVQREIACPLVGATGTCDGDVAVRCSVAGEGPRRLLRTDCSTLLQTCGRDAAGAIACIDPS